MGVDPEIDDVMARQPRRLTERVIDRQMWLGILIGLVMAVVTLLTIDIFLPGGLIEGSDDLAVARTAGFTVLVFAQLFNCFNARSETTSAFRHLFVNRWLWASVALSACCRWRSSNSPSSNSFRHRTAGHGPLARGDCHGIRGAVVRRTAQAGVASDATPRAAEPRLLNLSPVCR